MFPIDFVIRGHERARLRISRDDLERSQVDLTQSSLCDEHIHRSTFMLLVVAHEMFYSGNDSFAFGSEDDLFAQNAREMWVFSKRLKAAATERRPWHVDCRAQPAVRSFRNTLVTQQSPRLINQISIPGGAQSCATG
jgi:hypothetical protein